MFKIPAGRRVVVLRYHPGRRLLVRVAWIAGLLVCVAMITTAAYWKGRERSSRIDAEASGLQQALADQRQELELAMQQLTNLRKGAEIDRISFAEVRTELMTQRSTVARLEQEVSLYQSLIDSSVQTRGVAVHDLVFFRTASPRSYRFHLIVIQRASKPAELRGWASFELSGSQDGKERRLDLHELGMEDRMPLRFRYFQILEGLITLPPDFVPARAAAHVEVQGRKTQKIDQFMDWTVKEQ